MVFGDDMIRVRWAHGARGVVNNLTKNFFAVMSFQTWRALLSCAGMAILNYLPFIGVLSRAWMGAGALRRCLGVHVLSLFRDMETGGDSSVVFFFAPSEHNVVHLHDAALDVRHAPQ